MQGAVFTARTDLQIGDKVGLLFTPDLTFEVYDIKTIHMLRSGKVKFEFLLVSNRSYFPVWVDRKDIIYPVSATVLKHDGQS